MKAVVPLTPGDPDGPSVTVEDDYFEVHYDGGRVVLVEFFADVEGVGWLNTYELMYCERLPSPETVKVIRAATDEERRRYRVPLFIQGERVPDCCGRPMFFVGQIDDDAICTERPEGARVWWHDKASFYVFTCAECLAVKAFGQQM